MKQIWPNYSYSPATNVLTLTGLNIDRDQLLLVTAADRGRIMYNFADSSVTASAFTSGANTALTLVATTAGLTTTAALVIYYDDQVSGISGTVTASLVNVTGTDGGSQLEKSIAIGYNSTDNDHFQSVSDNYPLPIQAPNGIAISGTVTANLGSALPTGTNRIGVVTVGGGTVTLGASTSQIGSVTASISGTVPVSGTFFQATQPVSLTTLPALIAGTAQIGSVTASISGTVPISISSVTVGNAITIGSALPAGTNRIGVVTIGGGTVTIGAGTAQIGSVTASISNSITISSLPAISGTVTASLIDVTGVNGDNLLGKAVGIGYNSHDNSEFKNVSDIYPLPIQAPNGIAISGTVTARSNGISNDPWVYVPNLVMSHPDVGTLDLSGYYRFNGDNQWGSPSFNGGSGAYFTRYFSSDLWNFDLKVHDNNNNQELLFAQTDSITSDFQTSYWSAVGGTLVSGSLSFTTEQRESYAVRVTAGTVTANLGSALPSGTNRIGVVTIGAGTVTIGAGTAQIGSVTASISNTVVTIYSAQGTTVTNSNFTSTTASTTLVSAVAGRDVLTVFNEGAGNLFISPSATATTISYQVRLSAGDYWECPEGQRSLAHTAVFATAGTARVTEVS